ncbi:MAG: hypothetical protein KDA28_15485 [Phycisphaerales bacterium]|nr:hypothetical protein [Phycisphaerales bacterium]
MKAGGTRGVAGPSELPEAGGEDDAPGRHSATSAHEIRFLDALHPDPVSVKLAVHAFTEAATTFSIEWPAETRTHVTRLESLLAAAASHHLASSRFHGTDAREVSDFVERARSALLGIEPILNHAASRILPLLRGMDGYWRGLTQCHETSLTNYVTLANFEVVSLAIEPLQSRLLYDDLFPRQYEPWFAVRRRYDYMATLFGFDEPVYGARLYDLCGEYVGQWFWGPQSQILEADRLSAKRRPITNPWFVKYLIPQNELRLAQAGSESTFRYDERATVNKVRDAEGVKR